MGLLDHKTAVITGANSGIGLATATRFIAEGADRIFITGRRQPELISAATRLGSRAVAVPGDVGTPGDLDRLYTEVDAAGRGLDVVVANAGSTRVARLGEITEDDLDALLTTNVKGVVYTVQKALPLLNDGASIILIGFHDPVRALRRSCRDRQRGSVFGQRPVQFHDRIHHHRRRRVQPGLTLLRKQIDDSGEHRGHGLRGRHDTRPGGSVGGSLKQSRSQHAVAPSQLTPLTVVILWSAAHHTVDQ